MERQAIRQSQIVQSRRTVPVLVPADEDTPAPDNEIDEYRFTYVPRRDVPKVTLLPPDTSPRSAQYEILDRITESDGLPYYILRQRGASRELNETQPSTTQSRTSIPSTANVKQQQNGLPRAHSSASTRSPAISTPEYDIDDPSLLHISLMHIDNFVSPRDLEAYENKRYANPQPEDLPPSQRPSRMGSEVSSASGKMLQQRGEVRVKKRVGRPSKRRRVMEAVVVITKNNTGNSMSMSVQSEGKSEVGTQAEESEDVSMVDSIEDIIHETVERDDEPTLRANFPPRILDPTPMSRQSTRSTTTTSRSSMAPSDHPNQFKAKHRSRPEKSPTSSVSHSKPSRNIRSRASSSMVSSVYASARPSVGPVEPYRRQEPVITILPLRAEVVAAIEVKQPIEEQRPLVQQKSKADSNKSTTKPSPNPQSTSTSTQPSKLTQSKLSFPRRSKTPSTTSKAKTFPSEPRLDVSLPSSNQKRKVQDKPAPNPLPEQEEEEEEEEEYEVSHVLGHDDSTGTRFFRVAWVGWPESDSTWLNMEELSDAKEALSLYLKGIGEELKS